MESLPTDGQNKLIFDINDSEKKICNLYTENKYCPHILGHYLNPSLNSTYETINLSLLDAIPQSSTENKNEKDKKIIYHRNLSILQDSFKSFNYYGFNQSKNLFNTQLLQNYSLDWILLNNHQNL